ncbi:hypothetical protein [Bacillus cereus]|uniref:hypothetical protein n=1 Tax=Bacillus cereus TaxID=1396 RepID=UPI00032F1B23|nr:hypothetical protein [Bacillus cereus]EOP10466.1 hypothetical protein II1_03937 [Bacillus cereus MC118]
MGKKKKDKQPATGICALCKKEAVLEDSHIIPKFVSKHLTKNSHTGRLRTPEEPNRPLQDGLKMKLLCGDCEDLFSTNETHFSRSIFHPFKENKLEYPVTYEGNWLNYFITSVHWRILNNSLEEYCAKQNPKTILPQEYLDTLNKASDTMRSYLLGERDNLGDLENHIVFFNEEMAAAAVSNPHASIFGSILGKAIVSEKDNSIHIFSNLSGIVMFTLIKKHQEEWWINTTVQNESGEFSLPQRFNSPVILSIKSLETDRQEFNKGLSPNQLKNIQERVNKDIEGYKMSGSYLRIKADRELKK